MTPTIMAVIMLAIVIALVFTKKFPTAFVLSIVPIICALFLGYSIPKISGFIIDAANSTMKSVGYMLLFGFMYFTLLTETGMFDTIVNGFINATKNKINVYVIMVLTTVIAAIGMLTANVGTAYLVVFPVMLALYDRLHFDKKAAMIIAQTAISAMGFIPWGIAIASTAAFAKADPMELSRAAIPLSLCFIPVIVLQWVYFGVRHKKQMAALGGATVDAADGVQKIDTVYCRENPNARPQFFWINLIIFLLSLIALACFKIPAYMVFIFSTLITTLINYPHPKQYKPLWLKAGGSFANMLLLFIGISVFIGIFNGTGMMKGIVGLIVAIFPKFLSRYMYVILLAICVIVIRFVPYQLYQSLYPLLVSVGASFGLPGVVVLAPYVTNLGLATGSSPFTAGTLVGNGLLGIDTDEYCNLAVKVQSVTNLLVIALAMAFGIIR